MQNDFWKLIFLFSFSFFFILVLNIVSWSWFLHDLEDILMKVGLIYRIFRCRCVPIERTRSTWFLKFHSFFFFLYGIKQQRWIDPRLLELFMNLRQLVVSLFSVTMNDDVDDFTAFVTVFATISYRPTGVQLVFSCILIAFDRTRSFRLFRKNYLRSLIFELRME